MIAQTDGLLRAAKAQREPGTHSNPNTFTPEELEQVRALYATSPWEEILAAIPRKGRKTIQRCANRLGLSRAGNPRFPPWSPDELEILARDYAKGDREALQRALPSRSWGSICRTAASRGIYRRPGSVPKKRALNAFRRARAMKPETRARLKKVFDLLAPDVYGGSGDGVVILR